jgi:ribosomal protein S18 acetylase RimI-like enzyme
MDLPRDQASLIDPLLDALHDQFPDTRAFEAWRAGLHQAMAVGQIGAWVALQAGVAISALLYQASPSLATILAGLGRVDDAFLHTAMGQFMDRYAVLIWGEACGSDWPARLATYGARSYVLQTYVQDLQRVTFRESGRDDVTIRLWETGDREQVLPLLVAANSHTLAGVFLTMPDAPTGASLEAFLARLVEAPESRFVAEASHVAVLAGQCVGVVLGVLREDGKPFLLELATHPVARGKQIARRLVMAMQSAWLQLGFTEMAFITTEANAPVQRLFEASEIRGKQETRGGYWIRAEGT